MVDRSAPFPSSPHPSPPTTVDGVLDLMRAHGGRVTTSKRVLVEVLFAGPRSHRSAEQIGEAVQARAPDVHMSTIYRNLDELQRLGVVTHAHLGHGPTSYQLAAAAHAHFLCSSCGATIEAPDRLFSSLARSAQDLFGFSIDPHHVAIIGRCADCS